MDDEQPLTWPILKGKLLNITSQLENNAEYSRREAAIEIDTLVYLMNEEYIKQKK
jgi:hypothetical protein